MKLAGILFLVVINIFSILDLSGQCITLTSGNNNQTVCVNSPIVDIVYTVAIGVTDVLASNLPAGITGKLTGTTYTLSGSPTGPASTYNYTLTTVGICLGTPTATGSIRVNSLPVPTLSSSDSDGRFCAGTSITFTAGGGGPGAVYSFRVNSSAIQTGTSNTFIISTLTDGQVVDVVVTDANNCIAVSTGISNIVYALPLVTASNNGPVCPGGELRLTGGPAGMLAYSWSGPLGFSSANQSPLVSSAATSAMAGDYTLVVTNNNACQATATTTVIVRTAPTATASSNAPVCVGSPLNLTGGPAGMIAYAWSGPNGYSSSARSPQVSASATLAMAGNYTLTVTDANACQNSATTNVVVNPLPTATAGNNGPVCAGSQLTLTGGPSGMGSYSWSGPNGFTSTLQNPVVSASATAAMGGVYTLTVASSGCQSVATTTVTVNPRPVATAVNNGPVCAGSPLILTGGPAGMTSYLWSGPNGFSSTAQSPQVSAAATTAMAGIYTLIVTNSNSCQGTASTTVQVNALPVATAASNTPVCAGSPLTLTGGPAGMSSYSWTGPNGYTSSAQSPTVSAAATEAMAGTYTLTVRNSVGCQNTASVVVAVNALPVATAANNGPVCAGALLTLTGGPAGMTTYSWTGPAGFVSALQNPTVSAVATTAMAGVYTLTVTNAAGCQDTEVTTVVISPSPVAVASNNGPVCVGTPLQLTGGPAGQATYSWTGPAGFTSDLQSPAVSPTATLAMGGVYTLTVINATGCQDTATTRASVYAVPVSNAGTGGIECDLNYVLNAVPSVGTGLWTMVTGAGTSSFAPNASAPGATVTVSAYGTYTFRWTETNGPCTSSSVITVNFYRQPVANAGPGGNECDLNFALQAVPSIGTGTWTMTGGTGTAAFSNANSPTATVTVSTYGPKVFTWTEVNGTCSNSATTTVNFYQQPVADAGTGGNNCGLDFNLKAVPSVGTGTWSRVSGPGSASFSPNANQPGAKVSVTAYGTYVFRWTEVNGTCSNSETISVTFIQQPSANGGNGGNECDLDFVLNAVAGVGTGTWTKVSGPGTAVFTPNANQPNAKVTVNQFGAYDFAWTIVNSLCTSSDVVRVTFHDLPVVNAGADVAICRGTGIQLNATGTGSFQWTPSTSLSNPAISNPVASPLLNSSYTVTLTDQWGCKNSDQINITVRVQPVADAGPDQVLDYLFETTLEASTLGPDQQGEWTILSGKGDFSDINDPKTTVSDLALKENSYIWTVTNGVCPVVADTVVITVNDLLIPTLITPNLDGRNDFFIINGIETLGKTELTVFNRWGGIVFDNKNYDNKWDGIDNKGNQLPDDTYFFILRPQKSKPVSGFVVIRR